MKKQLDLLHEVLPDLLHELLVHDVLGGNAHDLPYNILNVFERKGITLHKTVRF